MNVPLALLTCMLVGSFGGLIHGLIIYGGVIFPKTMPKKKVKLEKSTLLVTLWVPGSLLHIMIGLGAGFAAFCGINHEVLFGWSIVHVPSGEEMLAAFSLGLAGSLGLNKYIDKKNLLGIVEEVEPGETQAEDNTDDAEGSRPAVTERTRVITLDTDQETPPAQQLDIESIARVIPTGSNGWATNHAFDLYRSLG
jgi:hypothetical protein